MKSLIFFASLLLAPNAFALSVVIDPGHGGVDTGAVYGRAKEAEISLAVAQELRSLLENHRGFQVSMTRINDQNVSLQERVVVAEKAKADVFLSIHTNASPDQRARGVEFYFQNQLPADEESLFLANLENQTLKNSEGRDSDSLSKKGEVLAIVEDLRRSTKMFQSHVLSKKLLSSWSKTHALKPKENSAIRQAPFYVVSKTNVPSVLVELGFLSNPQESEVLLSPTYQKEIAKHLYQGLLGFKEMIDRTDASRLH